LSNILLVFYTFTLLAHSEFSAPYEITADISN